MQNELLMLRASKVRLLLLDVDGVLTDGLLYFDEHKDAMKSFFVRDGLGLALLRSQGIQIGIITGRTSEIVAARARDLKIDHVYQGRLNKLAAFEELCATLSLTPDQVAYMGDDIVDLSILSRVGLAATVQNSHEAVLPFCHFVSRFKGGRGAVRELCDLILSAQGLYHAIVKSAIETGELFIKVPG
ncbi:MAG: HAD-IIIA family hydrolase [Gammaproteobacteria bacterium]|jgi:3-deoxy-D-manno-octulosonate 8-phosphate phosphatase (KDO 8-P phosphatase)|nr:HAD-IIIA family hydrolase [Gammaproteobacteria bacterium]